MSLRARHARRSAFFGTRWFSAAFSGRGSHFERFTFFAAFLLESGPQPTGLVVIAPAGAAPSSRAPPQTSTRTVRSLIAGTRLAGGPGASQRPRASGVVVL